MTHGAGIERLDPAPIRRACTHEAQLAIEQVAIVARALTQGFRIFRSSSCLGQSGHGPIVVGVLEGLADRLPYRVARDETQLLIFTEAIRRIVERAPAEYGPRTGVVDTGKAFGTGFGHNNRRVPADHAT